MQECEELILHVASALEKGDVLFFREKKIALQVPWKRISVREVFARYSRCLYRKPGKGLL